jgi:hypothetical protein
LGVSYDSLDSSRAQSIVGLETPGKVAWILPVIPTLTIFAMIPINGFLDSA